MLLENRRKFLGRCLGVLGATALGGALYPVVQYLWPWEAGNAVQRVEVNLKELPVGSAKTILYRGLPTLIIRSASGVVAISAVCTHLGCIVKWREERKMLFCPCHAARFDLDGRVLGGPAPAPLEVYPVTVIDGRAVLGA
ncbi:MAG: ubiquinol-cytochrome c reductase iron-sulfur subunit [Candidatus Tectomicrobia bacterium]|uniref:Ubiquinol-cytochrome c reductase iron-sulfur subunit n=1 Tax=Tectimicrobiota bacterium TaxID=2528274 RepID=A0A932FV02_UNCTE|nr:ubiquinol-cytochrome c reductase iron-sulfur subunit [Candidatus Tectomicrobia bacterium]